MASTEFTIDLAQPPAGNVPNEAVLLPLDNHSIPLRAGLQMDLIRSEYTRADYNPVLVRGKPLAARVVKPPFARNGKALVAL